MTRVLNKPVACENPRCQGLCRTIADFPLCNTCAHRDRSHGALHILSLTPRQRRPLIQAATFLLRKKTWKNAQVLAEVEQHLVDCRPYYRRQADIVRIGWNAKQRAKAVLATIHQQRGSTWKVKKAPAAAMLLAACAGTLAMPMQTSSPRYRKTQVAKAIHHILKAEEVWWLGRRTLYRHRLQSRHLANALHDSLEPFFRYWLEVHRQTIIDRAPMYKPRPKPKRK